MSSEGAILAEVKVEDEYSFLPKLSSQILKDGSMKSATLEDMYPFLDRDEFRKNMINY